MGYTHYWNMVRTPTPEEWSSLMNKTRTVIRRAKKQGIVLAGWNGFGKPVISEDEISFNGSEDAGEAHESFRLVSRYESDFCKTSREPYDAVVVAVLVMAAKMGFVSWTSDGKYADHEDGIKLTEGL
jgi:hypothetical protein